MDDARLKLYTMSLEDDLSTIVLTQPTRFSPEFLVILAVLATAPQIQHEGNIVTHVERNMEPVEDPKA